MSTRPPLTDASAPADVHAGGSAGGGDDGDDGGRHLAQPPAPSRPPHRPRHRIMTLIVVVLLIAIPAGYLVISAFQSRASGEDKARLAAQTNLAWEWPSKVQRRIYDVPLPLESSYMGHYEANSWDRSTLYVQFRTSGKKLDKFLRKIGAGPDELRDGATAGVSTRHADVVGWDFGEGHDLAGLRVEAGGSAPDLEVTVDRSADQRPRVFVVSTVDF